MSRSLCTWMFVLIAVFSVSCSQQSHGGPAMDPIFLIAGLGTNQDLQLSTSMSRAGVTPLPPAPPQNAALVTLGRALFFDKELSGNRNIACSTCHLRSSGTSDCLSLSIGWGGNGLGAVRTVGTGNFVGRNAPPLFNMGAKITKYFWDGRVSRADNGILTTPEPALNGSSPARADIASQLTTGLAAQAMFPVTSDLEMRGLPGNPVRDAANNQAVWAVLMSRLVGTNNGTVGGLPGYRALFAAAFPTVTNFDNFNFGHAAAAIAAFETQSYSAVDSPFEQYVKGNTGALTPEAKAGGILFFGKANCSTCHNGPMLTDNDFHGVASPQILGTSGYLNTGDDTGRNVVTGQPGDMYKFRTPNLHNVELSAPFTHSGAYASLNQVVDHYTNPSNAQLNFSAQGLRPDFAFTADLNFAHKTNRINALDPILRQPLILSAQEKQSLVAFLMSLTDPQARNLTGSAPPSVPSGLSID